MRSRVLLALFWVVAAAHLVSLAADIGWLELVTKILLIPTLAAWAFTRGGPRLLLAGLLASAAGDIVLQVQDSTLLFIVGMACFAAAHACYVTLFVRRGAAAVVRRRWALVAAYLAVWLVLVVVLWPHLGALQVPVAAYSLLLTATATLSAGLGWRTGLGGALFFVSDGLLALGLAELPRPAASDVLIMATYIAAQYLITDGVLRRTR
jgi:uncharacterized membrane protein YhhN